MTLPERFFHDNVRFDAPDAVVKSLRREPLLGRVTDMVRRVQPGRPSVAQTLDAVALIATEVAHPRGRRPAHASAAPSVSTPAGALAVR